MKPIKFDEANKNLLKPQNMTTDNEIIKGLERLTEEDPEGFSSEILDLINRQKAEIEMVKAEKDKLIQSYKECQIEIMQVLAEQIKMAFYYEFDELIPSIMADRIDELVKEMTGGK